MTLPHPKRCQVNSVTRFRQNIHKNANLTVYWHFCDQNDIFWNVQSGFLVFQFWREIQIKVKSYNWTKSKCFSMEKKVLKVYQILVHLYIFWHDDPRREIGHLFLSLLKKENTFLTSVSVQLSSTFFVESQKDL